MNYRAITIDDDPLSILIVKNYCKRLGNINVEKTYTNPIQGAAGIVTDEPDFIFLDMEMPELSGYDILRSMQNPSRVIVMSSNSYYKSFAEEQNASAFIQKPTSFKEFQSIVNAVLEKSKAA